MEEKFFFKYHLNTSFKETMELPIAERKWFINRFIEQKEKENEAIEAEKRKKH